MTKLPEEALAFFRETGRRGGSARVPKGASMLSPEERRALAKRGNAARLAKRAAAIAAADSTKQTESKVRGDNPLDSSKGLAAE